MGQIESYEKVTQRLKPFREELKLSEELLKELVTRIEITAEKEVKIEFQFSDTVRDLEKYLKKMEVAV